MEHEMKIHMDYLENKIELFESREIELIEQTQYLQSQLAISNDKIALIKESKINESKMTAKKLEDAKAIQS